VRTTRGSNNNVPRWVAMYLCQEVCGCRLVEIASYFGLKRTGSIPTTIKKLKQLMKQDKTLMRMLDELK
jgi:chromosomal replication initiation ATPase DnaA